MINFLDFSNSCGLHPIIKNKNCLILRNLLIDSRYIMFPESSLFFALDGNVTDGHNYITNAYAQGVRNFVVKKENFVSKFEDVNYIVVEDPIHILQLIATTHRNNFSDLPIIGITGSNGKTVVKEWLAIILSKIYTIAKTPKSYNSQIGVPLSVWQLNEDHELAIFEAGISTVNEMDKLQSIIQPTIGIFTNIGDAHQNGFRDINEKIQEKIKLFKDSKTIVYCRDNKLIHNSLHSAFPSSNLFSWGYDNLSNIRIESLDRVGDYSLLKTTYKDKSNEFQMHDTGSYYLENLMHCISTCLLLEIPFNIIQEAIQSFKSLDFRLKISEGKDNSLIINDAYTNDLEALQIALQFLHRQAGARLKVLILSDMEHLDKENHQVILRELEKNNLSKIYLVGEKWKLYSSENIYLFKDSKELNLILTELDLTNHIVLIKGSRKFAFEEVVQKLTKKTHSVSLEIDMSAIENNLSTFASLLKNETQIMPIIKASAYGTGSEEIAKLLQNKGVYALGVAFADEAISLRNNGIILPIVVLNADENSFATILNYNLELEVYSIYHLLSIVNWNKGALLEKTKVHIKLDTGMSRLGFQLNDLDQLVEILKKTKIQIGSIFSHLSSSEDYKDDDFSHLQAKRFLEMYEAIQSAIGYSPRRHLLNSSGIIRFPEYHFELVRLGLGLYGIDSTEALVGKLEKVHKLTAKIIQIKNLMPGDYVGYNRKHLVTQPTKIAILNIGYADGLIRLAGNNNCSVYINKQKAFFIGNICMDLSIIDITNIENTSINDEVEIFGKNLTIESFASACSTIPYEVLCRIAPRVKRNYVQ